MEEKQCSSTYTLTNTALTHTHDMLAASLLMGACEFHYPHTKAFVSLPLVFYSIVRGLNIFLT